MVQAWAAIRIGEFGLPLCLADDRELALHGGPEQQVPLVLLEGAPLH